MENKKQIAIGYSDYQQFLAANGYFVDKTLFIKEIIDAGNQVILLPRPRRFGKTLNLSMLRYYFDISLEHTAELFKAYKIWQAGEKYRKELGKYPVIHLSLKGGKATNFEKSKKGIYEVLTQVYLNFKWLLDKKILQDEEKNRFRNITTQTADDTSFENALKNLTQYLHRYYGQEVYVLIDEYDAAIHTGYVHGYYKEIIHLMKSLLGETLKDNVYLKKGVVTGILRVAKESIFSDLNNPGIFTVLNYRFADRFGFTEEEVQLLLAYFDLADHFEMVKRWYDGYQFGDKDHIYNPWSVINYIQNHREGFKTWWVNTSSDELIKKHINAKNADGIRNNINQLLQGQAIRKKIDENIIFPYLGQGSTIWSLLLFSGYLIPVKEIRRKEYLITIPNYEVRTLFEEIVLEWLERHIKVSYDTLVAMCESLVNNRLKEFEIHFKTVMQDTFSYFDIHTEAERVYQAYVLGLLGMLSDDYIIKSNRESSQGRYDILLLPRDNSHYGIVIEIKQMDKNSQQQTIDKELTEALHQIVKNKYYKELLVHQVSNRIEIAMVFVGKEVYLKHKN